MLEEVKELGGSLFFCLFEVASTSFVFVVLLNNCNCTNNYGRPELFVSDCSACVARFSCQCWCESFVCF